MPRDISTPMLDSMQSNHVRPAFAAKLVFKTVTIYVWSGVGNLIYDGHTYLGVGDFGKVGSIVEGTDIQAYGSSLTLSGIDPTLLSESINDIQLGAPATIYLILLDDNGAVYGTPYPLFVGTVDKPALVIGVKDLSITINLESRLSDLQRASMRRYTSADQNLRYPLDTGFDHIEELNDQNLLWR